MNFITKHWIAILIIAILLLLIYGAYEAVQNGWTTASQAVSSTAEGAFAAFAAGLWLAIPGGAGEVAGSSGNSTSSDPDGSDVYYD
jgi:hypothetical protein